LGGKSTWKAESPEREQEIFRALEEGNKNFTQLLHELEKIHGRRWSRQTLTLYLRTLVKKGCIWREKRGREVNYSLVGSNTYVAQMMGRPSRPGGPLVIVKQRLKMHELNEEGFIDTWISSVKFAMLSLIQDFTFLGEIERKKESGEMETEEADERGKRLRHFLDAHMSDLTSTNIWHGEVMANEVKNGILKPEKILAVRDLLLRQIRDEVM
jgi:hypothetical protein